VPPPGRIVGGEVRFEGRDLLRLDERRMRALRGAGLGMVFQEPMTALNPVFTVGSQVAEAVRLHRPVSRRAAWTRAVELLGEVAIMYAGRIAEHASVLDVFDHPLHPYTQALFRSMPGAGGRQERLEVIPGQVPDLLRLPSGCTFHERCPPRIDDCERIVPPLEEKAPAHGAACIRA